MLTQGKTSKVLIAAVKREPVVHIGEGSDDAARRCPSPGPYGQSLTARQVEGLHLFPVAARSPLSLPGLKAGVFRGGTDEG